MEVTRKQRTPNFPKNEHFLFHTCACVYQGVRNTRFSENLTCFVLLPPLWDTPFCLITDGICWLDSIRLSPSCKTQRKIIDEQGTYTQRNITFPAGTYLLKVNNRNTRTRCSKLTIKTPEQRQWRQWRRSGVFIVNLNHISHLVLVFLLLTLNM